MQEINNIIALLENLLNYGGESGLPQALKEKINSVIDKTKDELKLLNLKITNLNATSEEQFKKKLFESEQQIKKDAYAAAYEKIGQEFTSKIRCEKCGNNKIIVKHDYRADVLICTCNICGYEWDKDCLDKKQ